MTWAGLLVCDTCGFSVDSAVVHHVCVRPKPKERKPRIYGPSKTRSQRYRESHRDQIRAQRNTPEYRARDAARKRRARAG